MSNAELIRQYRSSRDPSFLKRMTLKGKYLAKQAARKGLKDRCNNRHIAEEMISILELDERFDHDYPFWKLILPNPQEMFTELQNTALKTTNKNKFGNKIVHRNFPEDYIKSDGLSNHFTQYARIDARFGDKDTPRETWETLKNSLTYTDRTNPNIAREKVYSITREANIFNPALATSIINQAQLHFNRQDISVLDPSAGWGDRLIGFYASGAKEYLGFDPNIALKPGYESIIRTFGNPEQKVGVHYIPFEESKPIIKNRKFELVMTSPPYFDLEVYVEPGTEGAQQQSVERYPEFEEWVAKMYQPYLTIAAESLMDQGLFYIYVEDVWHAGKNVAPMRTITEAILDNLGLKRRERMDLGFIMHNKESKRKVKTHWALCWEK